MADGGFYYLASPYSKWEGGLDDAAYVVSEIAGRLISRGLCVFCPIAHTHSVAYAADIEPLNHDIWLPMDEPFMRTARGLIVAGMKGWRDSYGIGEEIKHFAQAGKPRYLLDTASLRSIQM